MIKIEIPKNLWQNYQESSYKYHRYLQILSYINNNKIELDSSLLEFYMMAYILYLKQFNQIHSKLSKMYTKNFDEKYRWKVDEHESYIIVAEDHELC